MADYDIFREQLGVAYPNYGHALWDPSPRRPDRPVKVGDVGFIRMGKFHCLFNILCPKSEQDDVPEGYEPLVLRSLNHITESSLTAAHYCSCGVDVDVEEDRHLSFPDDPREVSIKCSGRRGGALLSLPVNARRQDTLAQSAFGEWIVKHIKCCFAFAQELQLGIQQMEDIILVTGCDHTRSWTNVAFLQGHVDTRGSFKVKAVESANNIEVQFSSGHVSGGVFSHGPQGRDLPENQCVFIRGYRVARTLGILPRRLKAAAGPSSEPGYDREPDMQLTSIPPTTEYRDPLHVLQDYIAERARDCDMILIHDDDLERIDGIGEGTSLDSLQPEAVMDLLRKSNIEIFKVRCDLSPVNSSPDVVQVAMLSTLFEKWKIALPSQHDDMVQESLPSASSPILPDSSPEPPIQDDMASSNVVARLKHLRSVPPVHQQQANKYKKAYGWVADVVVTCCIVSLLRWISSSTKGVIFWLFTCLLVNFVLSVLLDHRSHARSYRKTLDLHAFAPPSSGDSRSPCPALNALANHSILPHDGRNISAFQLVSALREYYNISLPLAVLLSFGGTFMCGRYLKIDLYDLARHNRIEHDASLAYTNTMPGGLYAPISVNGDLLEHILNVSKNPEFLSFYDLVTVRAARDATLSKPLSRFHNTISRGVLALTVQTLGDADGNMPKQFIREWFGDQRLPRGWKPGTTIGFWSTTRIVIWVGKEVEKRLSEADFEVPEVRWRPQVHATVDLRSLGSWSRDFSTPRAILPLVHSGIKI